MRPLTIIALLAPTILKTYVAAAGPRDGLQFFDKRQTGASRIDCICPPASTTVFLVANVITVSLTVVQSGMLTTTARSSIVVISSTTTVTSTLTASAITTCIPSAVNRKRSVLDKRQTASLKLSPELTVGTLLTSTTVLTSTVIFTLTDFITIPVASTVTSLFVSTATDLATVTPTVNSCPDVLSTTLSSVLGTPIITTQATASIIIIGTVQIILSSTHTTTYQQTGATVQTDTITSAVPQSDAQPGTVFIVNPNYVKTTITSGMIGGTTTVTTADGTQPGTIVEIIPTPALDCNNHGIQYAIQSNPFVRGLSNADPTYSSFAAEPFQTETPSRTGLTNSIGVPFIARGTEGSIYGSPPQYITATAVNHRGYLYAKQDGTFTFDFPLSDDITLLWVGPNAYGPTYSRANANLEQLYNGGLPIDQQTRYTYNVTLAQGQYVPFRILWANAEYDGEFDFQIYAPDGELITNASTADDGVFSPYIVQFSCDGVSALPFVPWAEEGPGSPGTVDYTGVPVPSSTGYTGPVSSAVIR